MKACYSCGRFDDGAVDICERCKRPSSPLPTRTPPRDPRVVQPPAPPVFGETRFDLVSEVEGVFVQYVALCEDGSSWFAYVDRETEASFSSGSIRHERGAIGHSVWVSLEATAAMTRRFCLLLPKVDGFGVTTVSTFGYYTSSVPPRGREANRFPIDVFDRPTRVVALEGTVRR